MAEHPGQRQLGDADAEARGNRPQALDELQPSVDAHRRSAHVSLFPRDLARQLLPRREVCTDDDGIDFAMAKRLLAEGFKAPQPGEPFKLTDAEYQVVVSLDGFIAGPGGDASWIPMDPDIDFAAVASFFAGLAAGFAFVAVFLAELSRRNAARP